MQRQQERTFLKPLGPNSTETYAHHGTLIRTCKNINVNVEKDDIHQEHSAEKISTLHLRLQQEAEKIRKWKIQTEMDLKEKDKKIQEANLTIDSLRKGILDMQIQNEKLSLKLQEEIDNKTEFVERHQATREMCNVLKDYTSKVEDRLQKCEAERTEMAYFERRNMEKFEELSEQFKHLEITSTEMCQKLMKEVELEKQEKLEVEKNCKVTLQNTESKLKEVIETCENQSKKIAALTDELEESKTNLEQFEKEYINIQNNLSAVEDASSKMQEELQAKCSEIEVVRDSLKEEVDKLNTDIQNFQTTTDLQKEEINNLLEKIKSIQDELSTSQKELSHKAKIIEELTIKVNIMTQQIEEYEEALKDMKYKLEAAIEREKENYEEIESLRSQLIENRDNYRREELKVTEIENEKETLKNELDTLKKESCKLKNELNNSKHTEAGLLQQVSDQTKEIHWLRKQISEMEIQIKEQGQEANRLETELSDVANLQNEYDKTKELLLELQRKYDDISNELISKNERILELENKLAQTEKSLTEVKGEKEKVEKNHEARVNELVSVFEKYQKMGDNLALEQQKEIEELKKKNEDLVHFKKSFEKMKLQLADMEKNKVATILTLEQQISNLTAQLDQKQNILDEKEKLLEDYKGKETDWIQQEKAQKSQLEKQLDDHVKKENKFQKQLDKLKEEHKLLKDKEKENGKKIKEFEKERMELLKLKAASDEKCVYLENENKKLKTCIEETTRRLEQSANSKYIPNKQQHQNDKMEVDEAEKHKSEGNRTTECFKNQLEEAKNTSQLAEGRKSPLKVSTENRSTPKQAVNGISETTAKKRRVFFSSDDEACQSDSSLDLVELQIDSTGFHTKDQTSKLICTQVKPKSSTTAAKPTIKLAPREQSISKTTHQSHIKGQNERKWQETPKPNIRKTLKKSEAKFFKSSPKMHKKGKSEDDIAWFDSDAIFGFGIED